VLVDVPVVSADGKHFETCTLEEAKILLRERKAVIRMGADGGLFLQRRSCRSAGKGRKFLCRSEDGSWVVLGMPVTSWSLSRLLKVGRRRGTLHRCLKLSEYKFVKLVAELIDKVRSFFLARALEPIIRKLLEAAKSSRELMIQVLGEVNYWVMEEGRNLALRVSRIAQAWGNKSAREWHKDKGFVRYLVIMNLFSLRKGRVASDSVLDAGGSFAL